jgi:hypothetical protein
VLLFVIPQFHSVVFCRLVSSQHDTTPLTANHHHPARFPVLAISHDIHHLDASVAPSPALAAAFPPPTYPLDYNVTSAPTATHTYEYTCLEVLPPGSFVQLTIHLDTCRYHHTASTSSPFSRIALRLPYTHLPPHPVSDPRKPIPPREYHIVRWSDVAYQHSIRERV